MICTSLPRFMLLFLDANKAFDEINHWILFKKLINRGIPIIIIIINSLFAHMSMD